MSAARDPSPTRADLEAVFEQKYGSLEATGWGPRMRRRFDYFTPDDHYEGSPVFSTAQMLPLRSTHTASPTTNVCGTAGTPSLHGV